MALTIMLNGQTRSFAELTPAAPLSALLLELGLKRDRVAVELNGEIVSRELWTSRGVAEGDRLEIVHFVGGGTELLVGTSAERRLVTID